MQATATNSGACAPQASPSSSSSTALEAEVTRLTEALQKEQDKLARWKEKAQSGVDELRQRIVELTTELAKLTEEKEALRKLVGTSSGDAVSRQDSSGACDCVAKVEHFLNALEDCTSALTLQKTNLVMASSIAAASIPSTSVRAEFDIYKRRMETTLRLQSKNNEALQQQVQDLQTSLTRSNVTLQDRERTVQMSETTVRALEQRLKEATDARAALEDQQSQALGGLNMEELNQLEERYETALQRERGEFTARENAIFSQHTQELQRLSAQHDAELRQLNDDWQRRLQTAVAEASQAPKQGKSAALASSSTLGNTDAAYRELLREHEALKTDYQTLQREYRTLKAAAQTGVTANLSSVGTSISDAAETVSLPNNLADAHVVLQSQFTTIQSLSQQLWSLKREALDMKRRSDEQARNAAASSTTLTAQQFEYLKSVVVNVLCFHRDDRLVMNLLPVLSTLLQMTPSDLRQICEANPSWASK